LRDFDPDETIMQSLSKSVLDCHEVFVPIASYKGLAEVKRKERILLFLLDTKRKVE